MKKVIILLFLAFCSVVVHSQWVLLNPGLQGYRLNSVFFTNDLKGYIACDKGTVFKTIDGGVTWDSSSYGSKYSLNSLFFTDSISGIAVGGYDSSVYNGYYWVTEAFNIILKTSNGGATWNKVSGVSPGTLRSVNFPGTSTGYAAGDGTLVKTINNGQTWVSKPIGTTFTIRSVYFTNQDTGYIVGGDYSSYLSDNGDIWKSTDGGNTWFPTNQLIYTVVFNSVFFCDTERGYVVGDIRTVMQTTDTGLNWTNIHDDYYNYGRFYSVFFTSPYVGYAVGEAGIILTTINGGIDWTDMNSGTADDLYSVYFPSPSIGYAVGSNGTLLKNIHGTGSIEEKGSAASSYGIYPNPADTKITIVDKKNIPGETVISICGVNGNNLIQKKIKYLNKDELDVSTLAKGVYLVKIQSKSGIEVKKLVIE